MNETCPPFVSVIIPMRNERQHIERCLASVINQDHPLDRMEILVIDGDSDDGCQQLVLDFTLRHPAAPIRLLSNPKRIIPAGLNVGIRAARGDVVVRVDAHTTLAPDYVSACVRCLAHSGADNVGGLMSPRGTTFVGRGIALAITSQFGMGDSKFHYARREQYVDTVYLGAYWRKTFDTIGLYDETLHINEDYELNYRLRKAGGKILLNPAVKSIYTPRSSLSALWRQYFQYGRWKVSMLQKHPTSLRWRQALPPLFVGVFLGSLLLGFLWPPVRWLFALVAGCYLLANLAASTIAARRGGWHYLPLLPVVFAAIHFAWGLGFLAGMARILIPPEKSKQ
jgi:glycosyltransferase involved in cell wall biosynthesis